MVTQISAASKPVSKHWDDIFDVHRGSAWLIVGKYPSTLHIHFVWAWEVGCVSGMRLLWYGCVVFETGWILERWLHRTWLILEWLVMKEGRKVKSRWKWCDDDFFHWSTVCSCHYSTQRNAMRHHWEQEKGDSLVEWCGWMVILPRCLMKGYSVDIQVTLKFVPFHPLFSVNLNQHLKIHSESDLKVSHKLFFFSSSSADKTILLKLTPLP